MFSGGGSSAGIGGPFRERLRELGYVEGQGLGIEVSDARGQPERLAALASELVRHKPDAIVVQGNVALAALKQTMTTIPIVMANIADPVGAGFVASLARPGGNITGLSNMVEDIAGKWVSLLKEVSQRISRVAVLRDPKNSAHLQMLEEVREAGRIGAVTVFASDLSGPDRIMHAFSAMSTAKVDAVIVLPQPTAGAVLRQIADLSAKHGWPAIYPFPVFAEAGGLMSYGPSNAHMWRRAAEYVDKILKGATPAELPIEQPTKFELVVNLKTARTLGIRIPRSFLVRADRVIE